jgi:predicted molibdopterin-dependent oxidoreductase YjgC
MVGTDVPKADAEWLSLVSKAQVVALASNWDETARAATLVLPMASYAEQDGTFVNVDNHMQRIHRALQPIKGRKGTVESAAFMAAALGTGATWSIHNWVTAFNKLKKQTNLLRALTPESLGKWGVKLEAEKTSPAQEPVASR